jgi:hypothetical protein
MKAWVSGKRQSDSVSDMQLLVEKGVATGVSCVTWVVAHSVLKQVDWRGGGVCVGGGGGVRVQPLPGPFALFLTFMCMTATVLQAHGQAYEMYRWYRPASGSNLPPGSIWFLRIGERNPNNCCQHSLNVSEVWV